MTCLPWIATLPYGSAAGRCLLVWLLTWPTLTGAQADPLDICLEGSGSAAINACDRTLEAGVNEREVYLAFGRHLERANRLADATRLYREGLSRYPGDKTLTTRLKVVQSNLAEQRFIERRKRQTSAQPSAEAKALFKVNAVRCRTLSGQQAVKACKDALTVEPDNALFQRRLAELAPLPERPPAPPSIPQAPPAVRETPRPPVAAIKQDAERDKRRAWTANIQRRLTQLGYDPGPIDGLPGARTRNAIVEFSLQPGVNLPTTELGEALSVALDRAVDQETRALEQLRTVEQQLANGRADGAAAALAQALSQVPWSRALEARKPAIEQGITELQDQQRQRAIAVFERDAVGARQHGDLAAAAKILEQALKAYPETDKLLVLQREVAGEQARRQAQSRRQASVAEAVTSSRSALQQGALEQAISIAQAGLEQAPENPELLSLRREIADARQRVQEARDAQAARERVLEKRRRQEEAERLARDQGLAEQRRLEQAQQLAAAQRLEQQRRRLAAAKAALREGMAQLAKVEAELAARELAAKLEAQRVLERMWP